MHELGGDWLLILCGFNKAAMGSSYQCFKIASLVFEEVEFVECLVPCCFPLIQTDLNIENFSNFLLPVYMIRVASLLYLFRCLFFETVVYIPHKIMAFPLYRSFLGKERLVSL